MRSFLLVMLVLSIVALVGCGGGGGSTSAPDPNVIASSADGKITLRGQAAAVPLGVTPTVLSKLAGDLPNRPVGPAFLAAADCRPAATTFSQTVALRFQLGSAIPTNTDVRLYEYNSSNQWVDTGIRATISADGLTLTVLITDFNSNASAPYYMLVM